VIRRLLPWLAALLIGGCVVSLEPLGGDADRKFDPDLVGTWKPLDAQETWHCKAVDGASYRIRYTDEKGRRGELSASLFAIGEERVLDLSPLALPTTLNSLYADHWVPAHTFARVLRTRPRLALAIFDQDWLEKHLTANPGALAHRVVRGHVVITASTEELRRFVAANLETEGAFRPMLELKRAS
jgi:hypothetical protein